MNIHIPAQRSAPVQDAATAAPAPAIDELGWGRVLRISVARASLALVAALVVWSVLPLMAGWTPRVIMSGSMEPRIHVGDIVVTRTVPAATLNEGQVITVTDPDHPSKTRTHRLLSREANGELVLKGDANRDPDSSHVSVDDVLGLGVVRVPFVGRPAYWMAERNWLALGATTLFLGWCVVTVMPTSRRTKDTTSDDQDRPGSRIRLARNPRPRRIAATVAATAVAVGAMGVPADAAFKLAVGNPASTFQLVEHLLPVQVRGARRLSLPVLEARRGQRHGDRRLQQRDGAPGHPALRWAHPRRGQSARGEAQPGHRLQHGGHQRQHLLHRVEPPSASRPG